MYILDMKRRSICKMNNKDLSAFLNMIKDDKKLFNNFIFCANKVIAKSFITKTLGEGLPKCHYWK